MLRDEKDEGLEKYVTYSVEELVVLRESYKARINSKIKNHWSSRIQRRYNRDIKNIIWKIGIFLFIIGMTPILILSIIMVVNPTIASTMIQKYISFIFSPILTITVIGVLLLYSINDNTSQLRKELRNIELVLEKKYSPDKKIMLDSNIINDLQSGKITRKDIERAKAKGYRFYITHIQSDEISNIEDTNLRQQLMSFMILFTPEIVNTHSSVEGLSRLGFTDIKDGEIIKIMTENKKTHKKFQDALIAETSIERDFTLLTNDDRLRANVLKLNGRAISLVEFKRNLTE